MLHTAAVTQVRLRGPGRDYYDRKRREGKSSKEALRALKRQLSDVVYRRLLTRPPAPGGPGWTDEDEAEVRVTG